VNKLVIINAPHSVPFARALAHDPAQQAASAYMNFFRLAEGHARDGGKWLRTPAENVLRHGRRAQRAK
jgi:hypothetical protein